MIKRLDGDVASRIAAGEVIERPVSVAKELIENSLDAGAKSITLYLEQGGKVSFVIEDDGIGIAFDELPLALERYATSKISSLEDLENITTLGYRGEALASVAAVSRMEIRSRAQDSDSGGLIRCEGGAITLHTDTPCQQGTRIQVDDLFFNLPARRKFLKNASAELRRIIQVVNDYAMIHPDVVFRVFSDGKRVLEHPGAASVDEMLEKRWGAEALRYYAASSHGEAHARVWWNPLPDSRRVAITLFVNGRRVQDATVRAAITSGDAVAYGEWLVLLEMPPEQLDVNIHPTKEEIRFRRSQDIFKIIYENTHVIFNQKHGIASADAFIAPREDGAFSLSAKEQPFFDRNSKIFSQTAWEPVYSEPARTATPGVGTVYVPPERTDADVELPRQEETVQPKIAGEKRYIGQTARGFLLFDFPDGLGILDPHAAHERILFEEICENFRDAIATQSLAVPFEVPSALLAEAETGEAELEKLGFVIEGGLLTSVPALRGKGKLSPVDLLRSALRGIEVEQDPAKRDREVWWRWARLACRDAVKLGQRFETVEAEALLRRLENCETPYSCPHGRPTVFLMFNNKLEEWFER